MAVERISSLDDRHLSGLSLRSASAAELVESDYDYLLLGSSWDRRCTTLCDVPRQFGSIQLFLPLNRGSSGLRDAHDESLLAYTRASSPRVDVIEEHSEELDAGFARISGAVRELRKELDRPLRLLVDLSAMPRYFSLGAVALGLTDGLAERVDVIYAEGEYGDVLTSSTVPVPPDTSSWEACAVPGLEGDWFPTHPRHFLVSVGFDAARVARLVDRWDPDRISVMLPLSGHRPEIERKTKSENEAWMRRFEVPETSVLRGDACDPLAAWSEAARSEVVQSSNENVYCVLSGSKPHGLGLALYSLARQRPAALYLRPTVHEEQNVSPNGTYWLYRLRDRTSLTLANPGG